MIRFNVLLETALLCTAIRATTKRTNIRFDPITGPNMINHNVNGFQIPPTAVMASGIPISLNMSFNMFR